MAEMTTCPNCKEAKADVGYPVAECPTCNASLDICGMCANTSGNGQDLDRLAEVWNKGHAKACVSELAKLKLSKGALGSLQMSQRKHMLNQMKLAVEVFRSLAKNTGVDPFLEFADAMAAWLMPLEELHKDGYDFLEAVKLEAAARKHPEDLQ